MACIPTAAAGGERGAAGGVPRRAAPEHEDDADAAEGDEHGAHQDVDHENVPLGRSCDALHRASPHSISVTQTFLEFSLVSSVHFTRLMISPISRYSVVMLYAVLSNARSHLKVLSVVLWT